MAYCGTGTSNSLRSRRTLPLPLSTHTTPSSCPSSLAVVTHTCSPHTTGDDQALPCTAVFHTTFSCSDHLSGRAVESETPWPVGPRNWGQLVSAKLAAVCSARARKPKRKALRMGLE